jgi:hypothetical protein
MDGILATGRGRHTFDVSCLAAASAAVGGTADKLTAATATHATTNRDRRRTLPTSIGERFISTSPPAGVSARKKQCSAGHATVVRSQPTWCHAGHGQAYRTVHTPEDVVNDRL